MPQARTVGLKKYDTAIFSDMFDAYFKGLWVFASNMVFREDVANDIVQDVFVSMYENTASFDDARSLKSYLYKSVRNRCYNYLRDRKVEDKRMMLYAEASLLSDSVEIIEEEELLSLIAGFLDNLPEQCREVCKMRFFDNRSFEDIAERLGIAETTVRVQLHRGIRKIHEHFRWQSITVTLISIFF